MTDEVVSVTPADGLTRAALLMREHDIGALPVLEDSEPVGIVTDRDIVVRALADGADIPRLTVADVMSPVPVFCHADQDVSDAAAIMGDEQIRRLLVADRSGRLVGILSLGDIAEDVSEELAGQALGEISELR